jgi:hypothetical protein
MIVIELTVETESKQVSKSTPLFGSVSTKILNNVQ